MISWLKFYFLGFFHDGYGKQAEARSALNLALSLALAFLFLCSGITAGYAASFGTHYKNAEGFRSFLYDSFAADNAQSIGLSLTDGKLSAQIDGAESVNTFKNTDQTDTDGYRLIVDTRPAQTTFDDFVLTCKNANGEEISYEDYRKLPEQDKRNSTVTITYTGNALDVSAKHSQYIAYLDKISIEADAEYNADAARAYGELKHKLGSGEISQADYQNEIYILFAKSYYPSYSQIEIYGGAPTLRTYYMQAKFTANKEKYLILLDDVCVCAFKTDKGVRVDFGSYFNGTANKTITGAGLTAEEMRANIDGFITSCFKSGAGVSFLVHVMNIGKLIPLLIVLLLILSLVLFGLGKALKLDCGSKFLGSVKRIGGYLFYSALATFIAQLIFSFVFSRNTVFLITQIAFASILVVRTVALIIAEAVRKNKSAQI